MERLNEAAERVVAEAQRWDQYDRIAQTLQLALQAKLFTTVIAVEYDDAIPGYHVLATSKDTWYRVAHEVALVVSDEELTAHSRSVDDFEAFVVSLASRIKKQIIPDKKPSDHNPGPINGLRASHVITDERDGWYEATGRVVGPLSAATAAKHVHIDGAPLSAVRRSSLRRREREQREERAAIETIIEIMKNQLRGKPGCDH